MRPALLLLALLAPSLLPLAAGGALPPDPSFELRGRLPQPTSHGAAVFDGARILLFGGAAPGEHTDAIVRIDPATGAAEFAQARLPHGVYAPAAVWTGTAAYVFGGITGGYQGHLVDSIVRYDPATDTAQTMETRLPTPRNGMSAVWDGRFVFLFGGQGDGRVLRYDPAADRLAILPAVLPGTLGATAVVFDGEDVWVFGGIGVEDQARSAAIYRFDPDTGAIAREPALLPSPRSHFGAAWLDGAAWLFGGYDGAAMDQIVRFDPRAGQAYALSERLPDGGRYSSGVVAVGGRLVLVGGDTGALADEILAFTPPPSPLPSAAEPVLCPTPPAPVEDEADAPPAVVSIEADGTAAFRALPAPFLAVAGALVVAAFFAGRRSRG